MQKNCLSWAMFNPLYTDGFFLLVWYNKLGIVFCTYLGVSGYNLKKKIELSENLTSAPLQCFACSKRPEFLKILSDNLILTSIKGHNSLTNLRKMTANNPNIDLVSIKIYIKFGQYDCIYKICRNLSICSQDIVERKFWHKSRSITLVKMCEKWCITIPM